MRIKRPGRAGKRGRDEIKSGTFYRALGPSKLASPILLAGCKWRRMTASSEESSPTPAWLSSSTKSARHYAGTGVPDPCLFCVSRTTSRPELCSLTMGAGPPPPSSTVSRGRQTRVALCESSQQQKECLGKNC